MGFFERILEWFRSLFQRRLPSIPTSADELADSAVDGATGAASYTADRAVRDGKLPETRNIVRATGVPTNSSELAIHAGVPTNSHAAAAAVADATGLDDLGPDLDPDLYEAADAAGDAAYHAQQLRGMNQPAMAKPEGEPPCSFEQYVEATTAQGAWAGRGEDIDAKMQQHFGVDNAGFAQWAQYWGAMMAHDPSLGQRFASISASAQGKY